MIDKKIRKSRVTDRRAETTGSLGSDGVRGNWTTREAVRQITVGIFGLIGRPLFTKMEDDLPATMESQFHGQRSAGPVAIDRAPLKNTARYTLSSGVISPAKWLGSELLPAAAEKASAEEGERDDFARARPPRSFISREGSSRRTFDTVYNSRSPGRGVGRFFSEAGRESCLDNGAAATMSTGTGYGISSERRRVIVSLGAIAILDLSMI